MRRAALVAVGCCASLPVNVAAVPRAGSGCAVDTVDEFSFLNSCQSEILRVDSY